MFAKREEKKKVFKDLKGWLEHLLSKHKSDDASGIDFGGYCIPKKDFVGEVTDWILQYLRKTDCPEDLVDVVARSAIDRAKEEFLEVENPEKKVDMTEEGEYRPFSLLSNVIKALHKLCKEIKKNKARMAEMSEAKKHLWTASFMADQNNRRKMEDRYVAIHDLRTILGKEHPKLSEEPGTSFYAVYDGHAGTEAAAFTCAHLHEKIVESEKYPSDPVEAIVEGFQELDKEFLKKEIKSGATAVCSLIRDKTIYTAWLGDSQAIVVRNGKAVKIIDSHKPSREDEKERIEKLGGSVLFLGTWRVNGMIAVSRAVGDGDYKPMISADADVTTVNMDGSEDVLIIGCDGLWDRIERSEAAEAVFKQLKEDKKDLDKVT